jgi:hypothetical protein
MDETSCDNCEIIKTDLYKAHELDAVKAQRLRLCANDCVLCLSVGLFNVVYNRKNLHASDTVTTVSAQYHIRSHR